MLMLENALRVLRSSIRSLYAPLQENAFAVALIVALACNSPELTHQLRSSSLLLATALSSLIVPHRRSCL